MASFCFDFISILMLSTAWAAQNFVPVSVCPRDLYSWNLESGKKNCQGDTPDYLCAAIENQVGKFGEICTKFGLTPANKCAVLNEQTHNLDSVDCKADSGCPAQPYIPSVLWQYQICYKDFYGTTTTLAPITTRTITSTAASSGSEDGGSGSGAGVVLTVVISLIFVAVVVIVVFCIFRDKVRQLYTGLRQGFQHSDRRVNVPCSDVENEGDPDQKDPLLRDDEAKQKTKKLKELQKYLVHILKQELGINDLKEKAMIYSKSINEHFSELLVKDVLGLKDVKDYSQLDTSLVFALLRNFCEGIKPSSKGWDYEPPDDETHVGADIERIRFMWNKYCDNDLQFKHLDDVYNRMEQKYGTVAVHGDDGFKKSPHEVEENEEDFYLIRSKIQSIKLNPDCTVEKGIVITESITAALKILKSRNVVILKGAIGCGKTHALKAIQNHFQEKNWETAWMESENLQGKISHVKPSVFFCDNLFGKFGSSVFSQDAVNETEKALKEIEGSEQKTKVVIGIHTHVYDEVKKCLRFNFLHQKNITVEMDNLSEAEALLIFKEQLKQGHCKKDSNCWFKTVGFQSVLDKLSKNQGHIGGPFLSLMYCNQHELFSDETFSLKPVEILMKYFQRKRLESPTHYDCLIYLMCVQQHNIEKEPEKWADRISVEITKHNLMELARTSGLLQVDNKRATFAHELLTTALFKSTAETIAIWQEIFLPVLQKCGSDVFIQLSRPTDSTHSDLYFEYMYDSTCKSSSSVQIGKMCAHRLASIYKVKTIAHPLMTVEFVKKKYSEYLNREPKDLYLI